MVAVKLICVRCANYSILIQNMFQYYTTGMAPDVLFKISLCKSKCFSLDNKIHGANMGPIWGRQDPGGSHVGPMNFAIWVVTQFFTYQLNQVQGWYMITKAFGTLYF